MNIKNNLGRAAGVAAAAAAIGWLGPTGLASASTAHRTLPGNPVGNQYSALAYSPSTQITGLGGNPSYLPFAEDEALGACLSRGGTDCKVVLWWKDGWGALAVGTNGAWGTDWDADEEGAAYKALQACNNYGGTDCSVLVDAPS
jgi:hypothetical protein